MYTIKYCNTKINEILQNMKVDIFCKYFITEDNKKLARYPIHCVEDWLREEYNLCIYIGVGFYYDGGKKWSFSICRIGKKGLDYMYPNELYFIIDDLYDTYYEALNQAIEYCLNLIKKINYV